MMKNFSFTQHLLEAIVLNSKRAFYYAFKSYFLSVPLSATLIFLEIIVLPFAFYFDIKGRKFNLQKINIVKDDFISMSQVNLHSTTTIYHDRVDSHSFTCLKDEVQSFLKNYHDKTFETLVIELSRLLEYVHVVEKQTSSHFSMTLHIIESVGFFTQNSIKYEKQSRGETLSLSKNMIRFQLLGLLSALYLDRWAQFYHDKTIGIGIVVNDMPKIPFKMK